MKSGLPEAFELKMRKYLGDEGFEAYVKALESPRTYSLRANRLKISKDALRIEMRDSADLRDDVPWSSDGIYFESGEGKMPGRNPFYLAGLYYIQEPSAMLPAEVLGAKPGERILDLCAAPGGKSTEIASCLQGDGLLVSNDISEPRANTLLYNLELSGVKNIIVTCESPDRLAKHFGQFFDRILIDAPCSGEGMFRKDDKAIESWDNYKTEQCASLQREILDQADKMLRPGGTIVYSTCTFDMGEDELMIEEFMGSHEGYSLSDIRKIGGIAPGFDIHSDGEFCKTARLWPHKLRGEGHFTALLRKNEDALSENNALKPGKCSSFTVLKEIPDEFKTFIKKNMSADYISGKYFYTMKEQLFMTDFEPLPVDKLKVLRMGIHVGEIGYGKLKPSQSFIISTKEGDFKRTVDLDYRSDEVRKYLRGESIVVGDAEMHGFEDGGTLCAVRVKNNGAYILGLGELQSGVLKNLYPKGWRRML